jgi:hypothetical protein
MRSYTILLATALTFGYGFAAQAAMTADRVETFRRVGGATETLAPTATEAVTHVWYGGMLPPVTVEVTPANAEAMRCYLP